MIPSLQADLNIWSQKLDGIDEQLPTDDLILSPPIIKLAPKARQVVRLALLKPADASRQLTYRMILREVPEAVPSILTVS
ncbi:MAG: fimbria/pilus periplasmic chaperone [Burkholderiaceae bacterium]|nr:fimbria/pilus periplasmic chaperone [Burkholderiaceae bacterium]